MLKKTNILILGAGIGGYEAFRSLSKLLKHEGIKKQITLVDRNNYFTFTPMLHEVASGSIQANQAAIPVRQCIYKTPHEFWQAEVIKIDPAQKRVETDRGVVEYEYCVVALGSKTKYFGIKGAQQYTENVRTLGAAVRLHQKFVRLLEDRESNQINMAIIGAGPTGVELAGQFSHLAKHDVKILYPKKTLKVNLVQAGPKILPYSDDDVRKMVSKKLRKMGVNILVNSAVQSVTEEGLKMKGAKKVNYDLMIWSAGFADVALSYIDKKYCVGGQIDVNEYLHNEKEPRLFALGDIAHCPTEDGKTYPKLAEVANKQADLVAENIVADIMNWGYKGFKYKLKGSLIPIGDWYAVAQIGKFKFQGRLAWWIRRTVYLLYVPGFLRKLRIVIDWTLHSLGFKHIVDLDLVDDICEKPEDVALIQKKTKVRKLSK